MSESSGSRDDELEQAIALAMRWKDDHGPDQPHKSLGLLARALLDSRAALVMAEARVTQSETRSSPDDFHGGTLAALDIVYLHDQEVIAAEIVNATDHEALLRYAVGEGYMNLGKLKATIKRQNDAIRR